EVAVGHERDALRAARHVAQLRQGLVFMRAEDHRLVHGPPPLSEMHRPSVWSCACRDSNRDAKARRSGRRVSADSTTGAYETNDRPSLPQVRPAGLEPATSSFGGSRSAPAELRALPLSLPDSNQRPRVYQTRALPTELRDIVKRLEGVEPPLRVRSPALCPVELQAQHVWTRSRTWDARLFGPPLYRLSYPDESSRRDSNPWPRGPEPRALPAAPLLGGNRSGRDRTPVSHICSRRRRTRGRPSGHQRESRPRQARR